MKQQRFLWHTHTVFVNSERHYLQIERTCEVNLPRSVQLSKSTAMTHAGCDSEENIQGTTDLSHLRESTLSLNWILLQHKLMILEHLGEVPLHLTYTKHRILKKYLESSMKVAVECCEDDVLHHGQGNLLQLPVILSIRVSCPVNGSKGIKLKFWSGLVKARAIIKVERLSFFFNIGD